MKKQLLKKKRIQVQSAKIDTLFMTKMAKIDTLFMTKTAENPNPTLWGRTYLYSPYKGVPPPPRGLLAVQYGLLNECMIN